MAMGGLKPVRVKIGFPSFSERPSDGPVTREFIHTTSPALGSGVRQLWW